MIRFVYFYRVILLWAMGCSLTFAAETDVAQEAAKDTVKSVAVMTRQTVDPINGGSLMQLTAGLILVIALILALAWVLKRYSGFSGQYKGLRVIASVPLTTREKLVLVQAGEQQLLLGVAPGRVNLLQSYDQPLIESGRTAGEFAAKLQQALSRKEAE